MTECTKDEHDKEETHALISYMHAWRMARPRATGLSTHEPRPSDVIITTFPKAGTTLMQQMTYQVLVASGHAPPSDPEGEAFTDICDIAPWINISSETAQGFETNPRLYKSHSVADVFDIGAHRHMVVLRDPAKFAASWLDYMADNYADDIAQRMYNLGRPILDAAFRVNILGLPGLPDSDVPLPSDRQWFHFTQSWLEHAHRNDILILFYEHIVADLAATVKMIATFVGVHLPEHAMPTIIHRCSRNYMAQGTRFKSLWDARVFKTNPSITKVQTNRPHTFARFSLTDKQNAALTAKMKQIFHVDSYAQLKKQVSANQREKIRNMEQSMHG